MKLKAKDIKYRLDMTLTNAFAHMQAIEAEVAKLGIKNDGTDKPEDLQRAQIFTLILTLLNDTVHCAHDYAYDLFKGYDKELDRYRKNQQIAFEKKLVNECVCQLCSDQNQEAKA